VLTYGVDDHLITIIREGVIETGSEIIELEIMTDHFHLLVEVDPQLGVHRLVELLKGKTSHTLRSVCPWLVSRLPSL
jgi:putative transposase